MSFHNIPVVAIFKTKLEKQNIWNNTSIKSFLGNRQIRPWSVTGPRKPNEIKPIDLASCLLYYIKKN